MLVGAVVDHQIHDDVHIPLLRFRQQNIKLLHGAEFFGDGVVVRNVVALIHKGGLING